MVNGEDISDIVIHWVSGLTYEDAFEVFYEIVSKNVIFGSSDKIRGSHTCICFTETPAKHFSFHKRHYKPFGIGFTKKYLFELGARPVIYEADQEYANLPDSMKWRHVYYDPTLEIPIDFTWEREWRLNEEVLYLHPEEATIILPGTNWGLDLIARFDDDESHRYRSECIGYGESNVGEPERLPYAVIFLNEL